jgi:hypothetical protein
MIARFNDVFSLVAVLIAAAGLILRWTFAPVLFLILLSCLLIDPSFQGLLGRTQSLSDRSDLLSQVLLCTSILAYLIAQYRVLSFVHQSMPIDPPPRRKGQPEPAVPRRPVAQVAEREPIVAAILGLGAVAVGVAAWSALVWFERGQRLGNGWGIYRPFARAMLSLWTIGFVAILTGVVFRYIALRRMSRLQARLLLQNMFWQETRREQERIHRWRRWARFRGNQ